MDLKDDIDCHIYGISWHISDNVTSRNQISFVLDNATYTERYHLSQVCNREHMRIIVENFTEQHIIIQMFEVLKSLGLIYNNHLWRVFEMKIVPYEWIKNTAYMFKQISSWLIRL